MAQLHCPQRDHPYDCKILDACPKCELDRDYALEVPLSPLTDADVREWVRCFSGVVHREGLGSLEGVGH